MRKLVLLMLALMTIFSLNAQQRTGDIYGKVTDPEGAPLPGVTITLTGSVVGKIEAVTNEQGVFRFKALSPANDYEVTAELEGFKKSVRKTIQVFIGGNTEVNHQMVLGTLSEEVVVLASAPVVNTKSTQVATVVTRNELQSLPTGRDPFIILAMAPGIQTDRENMAGSESGQQATSVGRGASSYDNNMWNVDGINVTDPAAIGATPTYWDFDAFEEMNVTIGGADVTVQTGGVSLNMVTRRGGNRHSLGGRFYVTDSAFQDENLTDELKAKGVTATNGIRSIKDYGFNLGGPLVKNKAFYWVSFGVQDIKTTTLTGANDDTLLTNYAFKVNIQPIEANRFEAFLHAGGKTKEGRSVSISQPSGLMQGGQAHFGSPIIKLQDEHTFGSNLFLSLKYAFSDAGFRMWPVIDKQMQHFQWRNQTTTVRTGSYTIYDVKRPKQNYAGQLTYFNDKVLGGQHELMLGVEFTRMNQDVLSGNSATGSGYVGTNYNTPQFDLTGDGKNDVPGTEWMRWYNTRPYISSQWLSQWSAYLQDNMTYGRFMIKAGVRLDLYQPELKATSFDGMPIEHVALSDVAPQETLNALDTLFPAAEAPAVKPTQYKWTNISPRLGLTWDLQGNGKTIAKLALATYGDVMGTGDADWFTPFGTSGWMAFWWKDNGDKKAALNELYWLKKVGSAYVPYRIYDDAGNFIGDHTASYNYSWGGYDWDNATGTTPSTRYANEYSSARTYEALITVERELTKDLALSFDATYRMTNNYNWDRSYWPTDEDNLAAGGTVFNSSMFVPMGNIPATITTNKGVVSTEGASGRPWYSVDDSYTYTDYNWLDKRPGLSYNFWAFDVILTKRLSRKWMASSSFTYQNQWAKYGDGSYLNQTDLWSYNNQPYAPWVGAASGFINQPVFSHWMLKFSGLYQAPWDINISTVITGHQGNINERGFFVYDQNTCNLEYEPYNTSLDSKAIWIPIEEFGTTRLPNLWDITLRAEKMVKVGENQTVYIMFDLFNVFNWNTIDRQYQEYWGVWYQNSSSFVPEPTNGKVYRILNPRVFRLGVRFQF